MSEELKCRQPAQPTSDGISALGLHVTLKQASVQHAEQHKNTCTDFKTETTNESD
jgi:hypothetical protein